MEPVLGSYAKKGPNMEQISGLLGFLEARQCGLTVSLTDMSGG